MAKPKILYLDIETAPAHAFVWSLFAKYISIDQVAKGGRTICWAASWHGKREVEYAGLDTNTEEEMVRRIHELVDEADIVVHYNGTKFDMPILNREFIRHGLVPPSHYHQIDLLKTVRKNFRFDSNKLDYVCRELGIGAKTQHKGFKLWAGCMDGDPSDWRKMQQYNKQDVRLLKPLYKRLLPWIHNHPNMGMWIDDPKKPTCTNCGSTRVVSKGTQYNSRSASYQRYKCEACGTPLRARLAKSRTSPNVLARTP